MTTLKRSARGKASELHGDFHQADKTEEKSDPDALGGVVNGFTRGVNGKDA
jgi:hypothetical protein